MTTMEVSPCITLLLSWGFVGVAGLALAEKLIPILPSYVLLLFLGMTVVGETSALPSTIAATLLGSAAGNLFWYGFGRALGAERVAALVARFGRYVFLSAALYDRLTLSYRRNQFWVTLVGQTIPTVRIYLALPAGVLRLPLGCFLAATILGSLLWNAPLVSLGYLLRGSGHDPAAVGLVVVAVLIAAELILILALRRRRPATSRP